MAEWTCQEIHQRAAHADASRAHVQVDIDECMALAMPWRSRFRRHGGMDRLFDGTGPTSTQRFASKYQAGMTPPFQRFVKLEAGPMVPDQLRDKINAQLELRTNIVHAVLDASAFPNKSHESYADLAIGTGALLATKGTVAQPMTWQSAVPWQLGIEEGPTGRVENVFWPNGYPAWTLARHWPGATWGREIQKLIDTRSTEKVELLQASYYDDAADRWRLTVMPKNKDAGDIAWVSERRSNPWIINRWFTTTGDPWGRGPLMLSKADIKTANKTVEMVLRAAAYSLAPPLMVRHDGVLNPDQMRMAPSSLIRVGATGGAMGASIAPLDIGSKVDLAQIVLQDLRSGIKRNLLDEQLPPVNGAVRSPTEIIERAKELQSDAGSAYARAMHEYIPAVVAAVIDILDSFNIPLLDWDQLKIDHLILKVTIVSPLARTQQLDDVQNIVQWLETLKAIGGPEMVIQASVIEKVGPQLGRLMGVFESMIRSQADRTRLEQVAGKVLAAQQPQSAPGQSPAPAGGPTALAGGAAPAPFVTAPANLGLTAPPGTAG